MSIPLTRRHLLLGGAAIVALPRRARAAEVSIRTFGARGDGRADDTKAFLALNAHLRRLQAETPGQPLVVRLPKGHYRYRWNGWLAGLLDVEVRGEEATLQCISDSPWDSRKAALVTNGDFFLPFGPDIDPGAARMELGARIETASRGDTSVMLRPGQDMLPVRPGAAVCIYSHDQQFEGYPPNPRYFDFARVTGISGRTLRLDTQLAHDHSASGLARAGSDTSFGGARIVALDRPDAVFCRRMRLSGLTFAANPNVTGGLGNTVQVTGVDDFAMSGCRGGTAVFTMGRRHRATTCDFDFMEPDKLLGALVLEDCRIGRISQATGVDDVTLLRCAVGAGSDIQARRVALRECTLSGTGAALYGLDGFTPTDRLEITGCTFTGAGAERTAAVTANPLITLPIGGRVRMEGSAVTLPAASAAARSLYGFLAPGALVLFGGTFAGTTFCDGRTAVLRALVVADNRLRLELDRPVTARRGDILFAHRVQGITASGNRFQRVSDAPPLAPRLDWQDRVEAGRVWRWRITGAAQEQRILNCPGRPQRITVDVMAPSPGATVRLVGRTPGQAPTIAPLDLGKAGRQQRRLEGAAYGWDYFLVHDCGPQGCPPLDYSLEIETTGLAG